MAADPLASLDSAAPAPDPWHVVSGFAPYLRIAHQIAGRVRLKLDAAALDDATLRRYGTDRLRAAIDSIRGVRNIQLNLLARSCVVEYDSATIPDAAWPDLLAGRRTAAAATLIDILQEKYEDLKESGDGQL